MLHCKSETIQIEIYTRGGRKYRFLPMPDSFPWPNHSFILSKHEGEHCNIPPNRLEKCFPNAFTAFK